LTAHGLPLTLRYVDDDGVVYLTVKITDRSRGKATTAKTAPGGAAKTMSL
jgi:hypothetical protein